MKVLTLYTDSQTVLRMHQLAHDEDQSSRKYWGNKLREVLASANTPQLSSMIDQVVPALLQANKSLARTRRKFRTLLTSHTHANDNSEIASLSSEEWNASIECTEKALASVGEILAVESGYSARELLKHHKRAAIAVYNTLGPGMKECAPSKDSLCLARIAVALGATSDPLVWPPRGISDFKSSEKL